MVAKKDNAITKGRKKVGQCGICKLPEEER